MTLSRNNVRLFFDLQSNSPDHLEIFDDGSYLHAFIRHG